MFSSLKYYVDNKKYIKNNSIILIDTLYERQIYKFVAAALISLNDDCNYYDYIGDVSKEDFEVWKKELNKKCVTGSLDSLEYGDTIVELSTCAYHAKDGREIVVFKKV